MDTIFKTNELLSNYYAVGCAWSWILFVLMTIFDSLVVPRTQNCRIDSDVKPLFRESAFVTVGIYSAILGASVVRLHSQRLNKIAMIKEDRKAYYDILPISVVIFSIALLGAVSSLLRVSSYYLSYSDKFNFEWSVWSCIASCTPLIAFTVISLTCASAYNKEQLFVITVFVFGMVVLKYAIVYMFMLYTDDDPKDKYIIFSSWIVGVITYLLAARKLRKISTRDLNVSRSIEKNTIKTVINHDNHYLFIGLLAYRQLTLARILFVGLSTNLAIVSAYFSGYISYQLLELIVLCISGTFHVLFALLAINAGLETTHRSLYQWEIERKAHTDRRAFLRYVFHEVRVPLNSISLGIELLSDVNLGETDKETVKMMREAATFMGETLNDVLAIQRIEEGALKLIAKPFNIDDLICISIEPFLSLAEDKNVHVISSISPDVPLFVIGDKFRLKHILMNLISNAVKYSRPQSAVKVIVDMFSIEDEVKLVDSGLNLDAFRKLIAESEKKDILASRSGSMCQSLGSSFDPSITSAAAGSGATEVCYDSTPLDLSKEEVSDPCIGIYQFRIIDEGAGISPANIQNLFNPFLTNHAGELKKGRGTGAGLAISNEIIKLHGGAIHVKSVINVGSVFTVYVPLKVVDKDSPTYVNQQSLSTASIDFENQHAIKASIESTQTSRHFAIFQADSQDNLLSPSVSEDLKSGATDFERTVVVENLSKGSDEDTFLQPGSPIVVSTPIGLSTSPIEPSSRKGSSASSLPPRYRINNKNVSNMLDISRSRSNEIPPPFGSGTEPQIDSKRVNTVETLSVTGDTTTSNISSNISSSSSSSSTESNSTHSNHGSNKSNNSSSSNNNNNIIISTTKQRPQLSRINSQEKHMLAAIGLQPLKSQIDLDGSVLATTLVGSPVINNSPHSTPRFFDKQSAVVLNETQIENYEAWVVALDKLSKSNKAPMDEHVLLPARSNSIRSPSITRKKSSSNSKEGDGAREEIVALEGVEGGPDQHTIGIAESNRAASTSGKSVRSGNSVVGSDGILPSPERKVPTLPIGSPPLDRKIPPLPIGSSASDRHELLTSSPNHNPFHRRDSQTSTASSNGSTPRDDSIGSITKQRANSLASPSTIDNATRVNNFFTLGSIGIGSKGNDDFLVGIASSGTPRGQLGEGALKSPRLTRSYTVSTPSVALAKLEPLRGLRSFALESPSNGSSKVTSPSGSFHYSCNCGQISCTICSGQFSSRSVVKPSSSSSNLAGGVCSLPLRNPSSVPATPTDPDRNPAEASEEVEHREFKRHVLSARGPASSPLSPHTNLNGAEGSEGIEINALIVDDVQSNRKLLAQLLSKKGLKVHLCEDGVMALEKVSSLPLDTFHVIFMDNTMPNMTGIECTKALRKLGFSQIIIGLTGNSLEEELIEFASVGADMALTKPLRPSVLDVMIRWFSEHGFASREDKNLFVDHEQMIWVPKANQAKVKS